MPIAVDRPYFIEKDSIKLKEFDEDEGIYVTRPPYQRKSVWSPKKQKQLIDSFFRRYYVPSIVLRSIVIPDPEGGGNKEVKEVVDGQQRIIAIQNFFDNKIPLPDTLSDLTDEAGKYYKDLSDNVKQHIENTCKLDARIVEGVKNPDNKVHQKKATEIFWRLQQGEKLTRMEEEHSKLNSAVRNYIVKLADDISFDKERYEPKEKNPNRHSFFKLLSRDNDRLQHLALLSRFLLIEFNNGPTKLSGAEITKLVDDHENEDLGDFEDRDPVKNSSKMLDELYNIFKNDEMQTSDGEIPLLNREYFIISVYLLTRSLTFGNYTFKPENYSELRDFLHDFYQRWEKQEEGDIDVFRFRDQRQQNKKAIEDRDIIIKYNFWKTDPDIESTDEKRLFSKAQRIEIYRRDDGKCQMCLEDENIPDEEAKIPWDKFDADHVVKHSEGGKTTVENGRLLCRKHN
ncbi:MAG: HNH endonuclease family protein, partial [Thermoplasmatota archaeon]